MSENTKIEWTDSTFNPWWGCTKISPACENCYASALDKRTGGDHWGAGAERRRTSPRNWNDPVRWNKKADAFFAEHGRRQRVFCASMADVFDNAVPVEWRMDLFELIARTPNLDWLILTKRIGNVMAMCSGDSLMFDLICERVWLGSTICNQKEADRDIPKLLAVPAHKRFLSMEPLLGAVNLERWIDPAGLDTDLGLSNPGLDWVIVGGESGPNARPMHPDWVRSLRDQCQTAGVPFLFKQWGEFVDIHGGRGEGLGFIHKGEPAIGMLPSGRIQNPCCNESGATNLFKVGKKAAGRLLDGREWNGVPA